MDNKNVMFWFPLLYIYIHIIQNIIMESARFDLNLGSIGREGTARNCVHTLIHIQRILHVVFCKLKF